VQEVVREAADVRKMRCCSASLYGGSGDGEGRQLARAGHRVRRPLRRRIGQHAVHLWQRPREGWTGRVTDAVRLGARIQSEYPILIALVPVETSSPDDGKRGQLRPVARAHCPPMNQQPISTDPGGRAVPVEQVSVPRVHGDGAATMHDEVLPARWEDIYRAHSRRVRRLAYGLTGNPHDADDLTQDVFLRAFRYLHTYTPGNFEGWLCRITTNLFRDRLSSIHRTGLEALPDDAHDTLACGDLSPADTFDNHRLGDDLLTAINGLPPRLRDSVVLRDIEGLPYLQIATILNIKLGTVQSRIHRGRARLRSDLADYSPSRRPASILGTDTDT
jgi:RNA polymerase sigma factor (sigma-70 family)